jgi:hypothetical protein
LASSDQFNDSPADPMRSRNALNPSVSRRSNSDRRQRVHLRELCDEVLASFRLASGQDPISEQDREAARELMRGVGPMRMLATN